MTDQEEVVITGFGSRLRATGRETATIIVLITGLGALILVNWYGFENMRRDYKVTVEEMAKVIAKRDAQFEDAKKDHRDILKAIEATAWILAQSDATKA